MSSHNISQGNRIWIYQTDRAIVQEEQEKLTPELDAFIAEWATHGTKIAGGYVWINPFILIIGVDEQIAIPSGCSLDTSNRFLRDLGLKFNIDFFVRMKTVALVNNEWQQLSFDDVSQQKDTNIKIVDTTLNTWDDFQSKGIVAPKASGLATLF